MEPGCFADRHEFTDSDAFAEAIRGWELDFQQLDRGEYHSRLGFVSTPNLLMTECHLNRKTEQHGGAPRETTTFAVPMRDDMSLRWRGNTEDGTSLMRFRAGAELDSISDPGFHVITISLSDALLEGVQFRRGGSAIRNLGDHEDVFTYPKAMRTHLRSLAADYMTSAYRRPALLADPRFLQSLEDDLATAILDACTVLDWKPSPPVAATRRRALRKAVEVIRDRCDEPVSIADVERLSGASTRTLRYAFQEQFGISPKQYLQAIRLNRVRRRLRESRCEASAVSVAANECGFWHMGQFAADYRRMFGELPSETLAATP